MPYILLSAVLYTLSFIIPQLWWIIILFTIPLHYSRLTFFSGFLWGTCAFGAHASGILYATMRMQNGPWLLRIIPPALIIIYLAVHTGIWFFFLEKVKVFNQRSMLYVCAIPALHTLFFWYISYACFWPITGLQGYPFLNPLLPLTQSRLCLVIISSTGIIGSLCILFLLTSVISYCIKKNTPIVCIAIIFCFYIPLPPAQNTPNWIKLIAPFQVQFSSTKNSTAPLEYLRAFIQANPHKKIFITPESAFYCHDIFNNNPIATLQIPDITCILGSFTHTQADRYNSLYLIKKGTLCRIHHKQHALALTESLPSWCTASWVEQLHDKKTFITAAHPKHDIWIVQGHQIEPYTCSEFFCHALPMHPLKKESSILLCCNDSWFTGWTGYASNLMIADAQLKAALWNTDIIYVGYQKALFITKKSLPYPL